MQTKQLLLVGLGQQAPVQQGLVPLLPVQLTLAWLALRLGLMALGLLASGRRSLVTLPASLAPLPTSKNQAMRPQHPQAWVDRVAASRPAHRPHLLLLVAARVAALTSRVQQVMPVRRCRQSSPLLVVFLHGRCDGIRIGLSGVMG